MREQQEPAGAGDDPTATYVRSSLELRRLWHEAGCPQDLTEFAQRDDVKGLIMDRPTEKQPAGAGVPAPTAADMALDLAQQYESMRQMLPGLEWKPSPTLQHTYRHFAAVRRGAHAEAALAAARAENEKLRQVLRDRPPHNPWCECARCAKARDALARGLENHRALAAERDAARAERDKLQAFKTWVHAYLDAHGVPHHPPGPHGAEGCRIGDRMDWLMAQLDAARAALEDRP